VDLINFILVNLLLILLILLPFFLIYKGNQINNRRNKKARQIFQEISLCRSCIIRNYKIEVEQTITTNEKAPYDDSPTTSTITKNFIIRCRNCNSILFNQSFESYSEMSIKTPKNSSQYNYYQIYYESALLGELKNQQSQGCSQTLYLVSGIGLLLLEALIIFGPLIFKFINQ